MYLGSVGSTDASKLHYEEGGHKGVKLKENSHDSDSGLAGETLNWNDLQAQRLFRTERHSGSESQRPCRLAANGRRATGWRGPEPHQRMKGRRGYKRTLGKWKLEC